MHRHTDTQTIMIKEKVFCMNKHHRLLNRFSNSLVLITVKSIIITLKLCKRLHSAKGFMIQYFMLRFFTL